MRGPRGRIYVVPMGTLIICRCASTAGRVWKIWSRRVPRPTCFSECACTCVLVCTRGRAIYGETRDRCILDVRSNGDFETRTAIYGIEELLIYRAGRTTISVSLADVILSLFFFPLSTLFFFFTPFHSAVLFYSLFAGITDASILRSIILHDVIYERCPPREFAGVFRLAARDNTFESRPDVISSSVRNAEELCRNA